MKDLSLLKNFSIIGIFHVITNITQLLVLFYLAKILGANDFGIYILVITGSSIIYLLSDYGLSWSSTRFIAQHKNNKILISNKFWNTWCTQIFINVTIALASIALVNATDISNNHNHYVYYGLLVSLTLILNPIWLFNGMEDSKIYSIPPATVKLLSAPLYLIFIQSSGDLLAALLLTAGVNLLTCVMTLFFAYKKKLVLKPKLEKLLIAKAISEGFGIFSAKLSISIKDYAFPIIISSLLGTQLLGQFSVADKIKTAAVSLTTPISLTLFPRMSDLAKNDMSSFIRTAKQSALIILLSIAPLCFLIYAFSDLIVEYTVGNAYQESAAALKWLSVLPLIITLNNILGMQILISRGYEKIFTLCHSLSFILGILIAFLLMPISNIIGASQWLIITELIAMIFLILSVYCTKD
jgi:O-antigen/teichoic acid export membrane protein